MANNDASMIVAIGMDNRELVQGVKATGRELDKVKKQTGKLSQQMEQFQRRVGKVTKAVGAIGGAAALGGITAAIREYGNLADKLQKVSQSTGISTEKLSALRQAASLSGSSFDSFASALVKYTKRLGEAKAKQGPLQTGLKKLDGALLDQLVNAEDTGRSLEILFSQMNKFYDQGRLQDLARISAAAFGVSGVEFSRIAQAYSQAEELQKRYNLVITRAEADRIALLNDNTDAYWEATKKVGIDAINKIGDAWDNMFGTRRGAERASGGAGALIGAGTGGAVAAGGMLAAGGAGGPLGILAALGLISAGAVGGAFTANVAAAPSGPQTFDAIVTRMGAIKKALAELNREFANTGDDGAVKKIDDLNAELAILDERMTNIRGKQFSLFALATAGDKSPDQILKDFSALQSSQAEAGKATQAIADAAIKRALDAQVEIAKTRLEFDLFMQDTVDAATQNFYAMGDSMINQQATEQAQEYNEILQLGADIQADLIVLAEDRKAREEDLFNGLVSGFNAAIFSANSFKDVMKNVARVVVEELFRVYVTQQLVSAALGAFGLGGGGSSGGGGGGSFAKGAAFSMGNVIPFAHGGVVSSPTFFPMSRGRTGLLGEAGPELIAPLQRNARGDAGVSMQVNVTNHASGIASVEVEQGDSGSELNIIVNRIASDIVRGGSRISGALEKTYKLGR